MAESLEELDSDRIFSPMLHRRFLCTVLASWAAEAASYPLDLVKTRLQIQGKTWIVAHNVYIH